jgi:hypothetical protein
MVSAQYESGGLISGYEEFVETFSGLLVIDGGGATVIEMRNSAHLEVQSTTPFIAGYGGIWDIVLKNNSHLDYYGGQTEELTIRNNATANLYGGRIDAITSFQNIFWMYGEPTGQHINLYCQPGWSWLTDSAQNKVGITGLWMDGKPFTIQFQDRTSLGFGPVWANINVIVPEPASIMLLALGGFLIKKRKSTN